MSAEDSQRPPESARSDPATADAPQPSPGIWPSPWRQFFWDLLPGWLPDSIVPPRSGRVAPDRRFVPVAIVNDEATIAAFLETSRQAHRYELARIDAAEAKGSRLLGVALTLAGTSVAVAGYLLRIEQALTWPVALPALGAVSFSFSAVLAFEVDRVALFAPVKLEAWIGEGGRVNELLQLEEYGVQVAAWTAGHKLTTLLNARAWFSRGLVLLGLAALAVLSALTRAT